MTSGNIPIGIFWCLWTGRLILLDERIRRILFEIELDTDQVLSSIIRSREEWNSPKYSVVPLHRNVEREGIRI